MLLHHTSLIQFSGPDKISFKEVSADDSKLSSEIRPDPVTDLEEC